MNRSLAPTKPIEMPEEFKPFFDLPAMVGNEKLVAMPEVPKIKDPYLQAKASRRCGDELDRINRWISAGKKERDGTLREIDRRRESKARRLEQASSEIIDAEFTEAAE